MTALVICVYDRIENIKRWAHCLSFVKDRNYRVYVIHNSGPRDDFLKTCYDANMVYVPRPAVGMDIGAFQDLCRGRLNAFEGIDRVLWCTDDTFPMCSDFMDQFEATMQPGVGVACMQISTSVRPHIRTTGFMIDMVIAQRLKFPADPITTKQHCYLFEHRDPKNTFAEQVRRMGLSVQQVAKARFSPLWDSGYHRRLNRAAEHEKFFRAGDAELPAPKTDVAYKKGIVTFLCTIQGGYPTIIPSLMTQTDPNWELLLIQNGKPARPIVLPSDPRIRYIETETDTGYWGHPNRQKYLQEVDTEFVVITNNDNYHVPGYVQFMREGFTNGTVGVYCSEIAHSYIKWRTIKCRLARGYIDCAGMMLRTKQAQEVGWNNTTDHSADWYFFNDLINHYGITKFKRIEGCMLCHN